MTTWQKLTVAALFVAAPLFVWMGRYDMQILRANEALPAGYILDRWTGGVAFIYPTGHRELPRKPAPGPATWDELRDEQERK